MFYKKLLIAFIFSIFIFSFVYPLEQMNIQSKAEELYLLNPLDKSETILNSNFVYLNNAKYWFTQTNLDFFVLDDKNYSVLVNKDIIPKIAKTYFFFSKMKEQNNKKIAFFFNSIPDSTNQYSYNIQLILKQLETNNELDNNVLIALTNIQTRVKEIAITSSDLTKSLMQLDSNLTNATFENYESILTLKDNITNKTKEIQSKLYEINQSNNQLLIILVDANISNEMKSIIPTQTQSLPSSFQKIPEYLSYLNANIEEINNAINYSQSINDDTFKDNWNLRLQRLSFLSTYLTYDKDLEKTTKQKNIKDLFDLILAQKDVWKELEKTKTFIKGYNNMYSDIRNKDFVSAERQIKPLKDIGMQIYNVGRKEISDTNSSASQNEEDTTNNNLITYLIIGIVVLIAFIATINIVKKIKKANDDKNKENQEQEVNIDFK